MWILTIVPDWIFYVILLSGIVGVVVSIFLSFIPFVNLYRPTIRFASYILIAVGLFMIGAIMNEDTWKDRVAELELKIAQTQIKSSQENVKIIEKVITKTKIIYQKNENIRKYIDLEVTKYDSKFGPEKECEIPKEFYKALNDAISMEITR